MTPPPSIDRLASRTRPPGEVVMYQNWENFLFLSWPVDPAALRPLLPKGLEVDTFEGQAWVTITPFKVTGLRILSLPNLPGLDAFDELNVRTYVHCKGVPGIWFFSLDASKILPVVSARMFFGLPYYAAEINFSKTSDEFEFMSQRATGPAAICHARWRVGRLLPAPRIDSLAFFLVERYGSFAGVEGNLHITRIHHAPWILREAEVASCRSTVLSVLGIPDPVSHPVAYTGQQFGVEFWPPSVFINEKDRK